MSGVPSCGGPARRLSVDDGGAGRARLRWAAPALAAALAACTLSSGGALPRAPLPSRPPRAAGPRVWRYEVVVGPDARELAIEVRVPEGPPRRLSVDDGGEPFVRDVAMADGAALGPVAPDQ